jgi:energy-coupling factor transporter transmembrane protein EcfT
MNKSSSLMPFVLQIIICLSLLGGGIVILALRIPGWSLLLGLPTIAIGIIFLIFTLDNVARKKLGEDCLQTVLCSVCGQPTPSPSWQNEKICFECEKKLEKKLKEEKKVI